MKTRLLSFFTIIASATAQDTMTTRSIFNGKDLSGWKGGGYIVEDGNLVCTPAGRVLMTEATFANYVLDFEFLLSPGANNGLAIHYPGTGDAAYTGMEIQILDSLHPEYKNLRLSQHHGSLYIIEPARQGPLKPAGEWNQQRVTVMGPAVKVELNGEIILRANLDNLSSRNPSHEGLKRRAGHIGWLGHGDKVSFRKIHLAELPPVANDEGIQSGGYTRLFDGKSLAGWKLEAGTTNWKAVQGILKHDGKAGPTRDLWTEKSYGDFICVFDWRWSARGPMRMRPLVRPDGSQEGEAEIEELDSGVFLRGSTKSQVNLWNWNVGSGEVYGYRTDPAIPAPIKAAVTPLVRADRPIGEWNRMMIQMKGELLTVVLNGKVVIDNARLPDVPAAGSIGLQHHGTAIDFANIWIKEM